MGFCIVCEKEIEENIGIHCIDCGGVFCEHCSDTVTHCFDCGGILCNNCAAIGLCRKCEVIMILDEDLLDEEIL